jgi:hypothetical protein
VFVDGSWSYDSILVLMLVLIMMEADGFWSRDLLSLGSAYEYKIGITMSMQALLDKSKSGREHQSEFVGSGRWLIAWPEISMLWVRCRIKMKKKITHCHEGLGLAPLSYPSKLARLVQPLPAVTRAVSTHSSFTHAHR